MSTKTVAHQKLTPETRLADAGAIWLARLTVAGLADDDDDDSATSAAHDTAEQRLRNEQRHHAQRTIESYTTAIRLFVRWAETQQRMLLGDLELDDLLAYVRTLRRRSYDLSLRAQRTSSTPERLSARSIHAYVRPLFGFLALAESHGAISFRLAAVRPEITRALPRLPDPVAPTPPDLRQLVTHYDKPDEPDADRTPRLLQIRLRNAALLHFLFSSAARISEALSLDVGDVCRDRRILSRVIVHGKGRREGTLFVRRAAEQALATYLAARQWPRASEPLFVSLDRRTAGGRLTRSSGWRIVTAAAEVQAQRAELAGRFDEAALLRDVTPHTFRHFVGYHLLNEGVALAEVSQILRHRSIEVTRNFYASYHDSQLQEVHDQFSADPFE
jgi:site-specific recombinase XerD